MGGGANDEEDGLALEMTCVSIAKMSCKIALDPVFGPAGRRWELLRLKHHLDEKAAAKSFTNGIVCYSAEEGNVEKAERWMEKLDCARGLAPTIEALNALLRAATKQGLWEKADAWFGRPSAPMLHPELGGLQPDGESYDIVVQAAAEAGDLVRAERYMALARTAGFKSSLDSYSKLVWSTMRRGEPRRAHHWLCTLVSQGCPKVEAYTPSLVKQELRVLRSMRTWDPEAYVDLVLALASSLAGSGNTTTANEWLGYLIRCGLKPSNYPEVWERVRRCTPPNIVPTSLFAEHSEHAGPDVRPPAPCARRPAVLSGEERDAEGNLHDCTRKSIFNSKGSSQGQQALEAPGKRPHSRCTAESASTRPPSSAMMLQSSAASQRSGESRSPSPLRCTGLVAGYAGPASPGGRGRGSGGLRRLLEAKKKLATADRAAVALRGLPRATRTASAAAAAPEALVDSAAVAGAGAA